MIHETNQQKERILETVKVVSRAYTSISNYAPLKRLGKRSLRFRCFLEKAERYLAEYGAQPVLVGIDNLALLNYILN